MKTCQQFGNTQSLSLLMSSAKPHYYHCCIKIDRGFIAQAASRIINEPPSAISEPLWSSWLIKLLALVFNMRDRSWNHLNSFQINRPVSHVGKTHISLTWPYRPPPPPSMFTLQLHSIGIWYSPIHQIITTLVYTARYWYVSGTLLGVNVMSISTAMGSRIRVAN